MKRAVAAVLGLGLLLGGCGSTQAAAPVTSTVVSTKLVPTTVRVTVTASPAKPSIFTLKGSLEFKNAQGSGTTCYAGTGGYDDIDSGAAVTVYDQAGTVVAVGRLDAGTFTDSGATSSETGNDVGVCVYPVTVPDVPGSATLYQVEISHRGKISISAADAKAGNFRATLGP